MVSNGLDNVGPTSHPHLCQSLAGQAMKLLGGKIRHVGFHRQGPRAWNDHLLLESLCMVSVGESHIRVYERYATFRTVLEVEDGERRLVRVYRLYDNPIPLDFNWSRESG